eukprot:5206019-Pyramimonas_sp.AAC.1
MRRLDKCDAPAVYQAYIPGWDHRRGVKCKILANFMLPHEVLDWMVDGASLDSWCNFEAGQQPLQEAMRLCGESMRPSRDTLAEKFISIGIWGDSAPYAHRDTLYLLTWRVLSGSVMRHKRHWFCAFPKRTAFLLLPVDVSSCCRRPQ